MHIRSRRDSDIAAVHAILQRTHEIDGYPRYPQEPAFVRVPGETHAWVAELDGAVVGHVSLTDPESVGLSAAIEASEIPSDRVAALARLVVDPDIRGRGVGGALMRHAVDRSPRRLILEVDADAVNAPRLYERAGWSRIAAAEVAIPGHPPLAVIIWIAPEPSAAGST